MAQPRKCFTRSCALNSLLIPSAVHQIRSDIPHVTEVCHEASLLLHSFLVTFPIAARAIAEQDVWYLFMTVINKSTFPAPQTSKGQRLLLNVFYDGFLPESPASFVPPFTLEHQNFLISEWNSDILTYGLLLQNFLNSWLATQTFSVVNSPNLSQWFSCRSRQLAANVKSSLPKISRAWIKNFLYAHCRIIETPRQFSSHLLYLFYNLPFNAPSFVNVSIDNQSEKIFLLNAVYFIFHLFDSFPVSEGLLSSADHINVSPKEIRELFIFNLSIAQFLETYLSDFSHCWRRLRLIPLASHKGSNMLDVPPNIFKSNGRFPPAIGTRANQFSILNQNLKKIFKNCPHEKFKMWKKSYKRNYRKLALKSNGNELLITFERTEPTLEKEGEPPKKKTRRTKLEMQQDPKVNCIKSINLKGSKKKPRRRPLTAQEIIPEGPLVGVDLGQSRLCGYYLNEENHGLIKCPTGRQFRTNPSPHKMSPNQYSVQNIHLYLNHWNLVRKQVYNKSNRSKWKSIKFDNRRRRERRFREALNTFQEISGHPEELYLAVGSANFPSHFRKVKRYGSARCFRKWLNHQKE
ncbi:hypothetical protein GEMRC1_012764 [Eukaryota sp. GEM-RC1]